eukprot:scaffold8099_cov79-Skeletonema_dohrnii-CCMP3373.AAC.6
MTSNGTAVTSNNNHNGTHDVMNVTRQQIMMPQEQQPLPDGWEEMTDPNSGRSFYIDHARQITTWERPGGGNNQNSVAATATTVNNETNHYSSQQQQPSGDDDYFNTASIMKLNKFGSQSNWDDDPHSGSRNNNNNQYENTLSIQQESTAPAPPRLDFTVLTIPDILRPHCPSCFNPFSYTFRRHHCRLCGDIFCDACSNHRTVLPLEGE